MERALRGDAGGVRRWPIRRPWQGYTTLDKRDQQIGGFRRGFPHLEARRYPIGRLPRELVADAVVLTTYSVTSISGGVERF